MSLDPPQTGVEKKNRPFPSIHQTLLSLFLSLSISLYLSSFHSSGYPLPFTANPVPTLWNRRTVVKRTTRSFALLSSFAGIKSVSLCRRGSPSSLFSFSRAYSARFWQEVAGEEPERKSVPGRPLSFSGTRRISMFFKKNAFLEYFLVRGGFFLLEYRV